MAENCWGITAGEGPGNDELREGDRDRRFFGYTARGVPYGPDDGTIAPWAMLATLPFGAAGDRGNARACWQTYPQVCSNDRFSSGFNPTFARTGERLAVRRLVRARPGLLVLMIENYRSGFIWELMRALSADPHRPAARRLHAAGGSSHGASPAPSRPSPTMPDEGDLLRRVRPADWQQSRAQAALRPGHHRRRPGRTGGGRMRRYGSGLRVALIERHRLGGDSLNTGSVPSKAIIRTARCLRDMPRAEQFGAPASPDTAGRFPDGRWRGCGASARGSPSITRPNDCASLGIDVFFGTARFVGADALMVGDAPLRLQRRR